MNTQNNIKHQVGTVIMQLMQAYNMDESSLAKACNISLASLSRIKNNPSSNPTISTLRPIADFFNITIDQLLGFSPLNHTTSHFKQIPIITNNDIFNWLQNKTTVNPITEWLSCDQQTSDLTFATHYQLENNIATSQNCLIFIDPKKKLTHDDLIFIYNKKIKQYFLRLVSIDDRNQIFLKPIELGFSEYISLDLCKTNIIILGAVIESRLFYKLEANSIIDLVDHAVSF